MKSYNHQEIDMMSYNLEHLRDIVISKIEEGELSGVNSPAKREDESKNYGTDRDMVMEIRDEYEDYLSKSQLPQNHEQKIIQLLQQQSSLGNSVAMFEMLYYFKQALQPQILTQIQQKSLKAFINSTSKQSQQCHCQLIAQCGIQNQQLCQIIAECLVQETMQFQLAFYVLTNQGITGLAYLVDLANRDLFGLSHKILDYLSRTENIIREVLVPVLMQDAMDAGLSRHRDLSLAALNRLAPLLNDQDILVQLTSLLHDSSVDKKLLLATIRSAGVKGEELLLNIIRSKQLSQAALSLALSVLSWRVPSKPVLRIKAIEYTLDHCFLPGRLYQYEGELDPWDFGGRHCGDTLCLSSRDLLSHLELYLREKVHLTKKEPTNRHLSVVAQVLGLQEDQKVQISDEVVKILMSQLKNKSIKIRQISLLELGNIGQLQATSALESVQKCLSDSDSSIRSVSCWTISKICSTPTKKLQAKLCQMLRDNFWKVRTSACIALGLITKYSQIGTVEALIKVLQDGSIPKQVVCESLARIGAEQLLLEVLKGSSRNDFKLKEAVIASFQFVTVRSNFIGIIVQELLRHSKDSRIETRQLCLVTLGVLRQKSQQQGQAISFFQTKKLLPFYYCFLDDPSQRIRGIAAQTILSFGSQAELIFIQGMTRGHPLAKIQCIRCLGRLGVQNFRAIVLGLRDSDQRVRRAAGDAILDNYTIQRVVQQFGNREGYSMSLVCNLRQVLEGKLRPQLRPMIKQIFIGLSGQIDNSKLSFVHCRNENSCINI